MSTKKSKKLQVTALVKLVAPAGEANPGPPIATSLGPKGVNTGEFCKNFNEASLKKFTKGVPVPVLMTVYSDRSFTYEMKSPPASYLIKKAAGVEKGAKTPKKEVVGKVSISQLTEIAKTKLDDFNASSVNALVESLKGSARSIGIEVID